MAATMAKKASSKKKVQTKWDLLEELSKGLPLVNEEDYEIKVESIPSGSISLDMALGVGGYPRGAVIDCFGAESAGKSLLSIMAIAEVQRQGGTVVVWDAERSYSKNMAWMRVNGVDTSKLKFLRLKAEQPAEIGFQTIETLVKSEVADLIVVDSVPSLVPKAVLEKALTDNQRVAAIASLMTVVLQRLVPMLDESKTTVMFINQMRANIGGGMYGPSTKETSHFALRHYSSIRLEVKKLMKTIIEEKGVPVGHRVRVKMVKNKVAPPYRVAEFEVRYASGVESAAEVADILVSAGLADKPKKSAWIEYQGQKYNGMKAFTQLFRDDKKLLEESLKLVKGLKDVNTFGVRKDDDNSDDTDSGLEVLGT